MIAEAGYPQEFFNLQPVIERAQRAERRLQDETARDEKTGSYAYVAVEVTDDGWQVAHQDLPVVDINYSNRVVLRKGKTAQQYHDTLAAFNATTYVEAERNWNEDRRSYKDADRKLPDLPEMMETLVMYVQDDNFTKVDEVHTGSVNSNRVSLFGEGRGPVTEAWMIYNVGTYKPGEAEELVKDRIRELADKRYTEAKIHADRVLQAG
jgi:hypothetical protein